MESLNFILTGTYVHTHTFFFLFIMTTLIIKLFTDRTPRAHSHYSHFTDAAAEVQRAEGGSVSKQGSRFPSHAGCSVRTPAPCVVPLELGRERALSQGR